MKNKLCKQCMIEKPVTEFSVNRKNGDNLYTYCKDCAKENNKIYGKMYRASKHGKAVRSRCAKIYSQTIEGKQSRQRATINFRKNHSDRYKCHMKVGVVLRNGSLIKPNQCFDCGKPEKLEAHHNDYSKPLEVEWLCKKCHRKKDSIIKTLKNGKENV